VKKKYIKCGQLIKQFNLLDLYPIVDLENLILGLIDTNKFELATDLTRNSDFLQDFMFWELAELKNFDKAQEHLDKMVTWTGSKPELQKCLNRRIGVFMKARFFKQETVTILSPH